MLFSQLAKITRGKIHQTKDLDVSHFSADTRTLSGQDKEVFVAVMGKRDGHDFVHAAIEKGVRNFILEKDLELGDVNKLIVDDSLAAFQNIAQNHREEFSIPVIGITGSNGKTTVKEWLSTILSAKYFVVKSPKSYNSQIGVPISLLEIRQSHEIGVFEAGISQIGEMGKLQQMIQPTLGIFTNLGVAHDDGFESSGQKLNEKLTLFKGAQKVICRSDKDYASAIAKVLGSSVVSWGLDGTGSYRVSWEDGLIQVNDFKFSTDFQGDTLLENLTHAIVMALELGVASEQIQNGINLIEGIPMRLELKRGVNGCYILDDSYNNDEAGLKVALDYLESHKQNDKRTLILSDLLHSGKADEELYMDVANLLQSRKINRLIGVGARISKQANLFPMETIFFDGTEELLSNLPDFQNEMVVVKGARNFALERVVQRLEEKSHGTVLEVNFESLQHNLNQYRSLLKPNTKMMVMVKANAYGSGILEVGNFLQHQRVDMLGVAYVDEAIQLRKNGVSLPIMIMNPYIESFEQFERFDLQAEIFSFSHLKRMLKDTINHPSIHLKIDTGMHRLGFSKEDIPALIKILNEHPEIKVEGIFTHFSSSDVAEEDDFTIAQAELFKEIYQQLVDALGYQPIKHACNSPAMVRWPQYHFDMVRLGIGLHGFDPTGQLFLRHSSELKSTISQIQNLKAGDTVGYSRKGKINKDSKIAVVPIGYEDGYNRVFGNGTASVFINGKLCPTIGNVCMDMIMVDVTDTDAQEGNEVIIFGSMPSIQNLANWANTIPYEILTNVSNRVRRIFISE